MADSSSPAWFGWPGLVLFALAVLVVCAIAVLDVAIRWVGIRRLHRAAFAMEVTSDALIIRRGGTIITIPYCAVRSLVYRNQLEILKRRSKIAGGLAIVVDHSAVQVSRNGKQEAFEPMDTPGWDIVVGRLALGPLHQANAILLALSASCPMAEIEPVIDRSMFALGTGRELFLLTLFVTLGNIVGLFLGI